MSAPPLGVVRADENRGKLQTFMGLLSVERLPLCSRLGGCGGADAAGRMLRAGAQRSLGLSPLSCGPPVSSGWSTSRSSAAFRAST